MGPFPANESVDHVYRLSHTDASDIYATPEKSTSATTRSLREGARPWMDDRASDDCLRCDKPFTMTVRRHHCRACGSLFCYRCVKNTKSGLGIALPESFGYHGEHVLVCRDCKDMLDSGKLTSPNDSWFEAVQLCKSQRKSRPAFSETKSSPNNSQLAVDYSKDILSSMQ